MLPRSITALLMLTVTFIRMSDDGVRMSESRQEKIEKRLTSAALAALIVDELERAKIVAHDKVEQAIRIATEEIGVRKALGDY